MSTAGARVVSEKASPNFPNRWESAFLPRLSPSLPPKSGVWRSLPPICWGGGETTNVCAIILCCQAKKGVRFCGRPLTCQWEPSTTRAFQPRFNSGRGQVHTHIHTLTHSRTFTHSRIHTQRESIRRFRWMIHLIRNKVTIYIYIHIYTVYKVKVQIIFIYTTNKLDLKLIIVEEAASRSSLK